MSGVCVVEEDDVNKEDEEVLEAAKCLGDEGQSCCYRMENGQDLIDLKQQPYVFHLGHDSYVVQRANGSAQRGYDSPSGCCR